WSAAYAVFALLCAGAAWVTSRACLASPCLAQSCFAPGAEAPGVAKGMGAMGAMGATGASEGTHPRAGLPAQGAWLGLSALGVVILLGATAHISQNVASVPFLWLVPLTLYLLSFVLAFEGRGGRGWYIPGFGIPAALAAATLMALGLSTSSGVLDVSLS